jgi:hypothetical protein
MKKDGLLLDVADKSKFAVFAATIIISNGLTAGVIKES